MNRADFIAAIVAAQDSAATTPRVAADQTAERAARAHAINHPRYAGYRDMIARCHYTSHKDYRYYGARGIAVCDRWRASFWNYIEDTGDRPGGLSLDRINNDGPYSPENVRWATRQQQNLNMRKRTVTPVTHCKNGHEFTPENTTVLADGRRKCRSCSRAAGKRWRDRKDSLRDPAGLASEVDASALGSAEDSRSSGSLGPSRPRTAAHKPATKEQRQ